MSNKKKSEPIKVESPAIEQPLPVSYGFTLVREYPGWRTHLIELRGTTVTIVETSEPDLKINALHKGERWIQSKTT